MKKYIFIVLFGINALIGGVPVALASVSYTASPLVIDVDAEPRDIISKSITLTNTGTQPVTAYPSVNNISLKEGGTIEAFLAPVESDRTQSLASWIEISRLGVDLFPGETKTVDITLRINPEPVPGEYHAFIGFGYGRNRDEAEAQVKNGQAPGTVVSVTIEEKVNEMLRLARFVVDRFVTKTENQAAVFTVHNPGDTPLTPQGEIIFYDSRGEEVGAVALNAENTVVPPGSEHSFVARVPTEGMFGKYKAFLSVEYGSTQRASINDTSFYYVLPLQAMLWALLIVCLLVALFAWHVHKKYIDVDMDESDRLMFHIRETVSVAQDHDLDLKSKQ